MKMENRKNIKIASQYIENTSREIGRDDVILMGNYKTRTIRLIKSTAFIQVSRALDPKVIRVFHHMIIHMIL